jgi:hypothetical protein
MPWVHTKLVPKPQQAETLMRWLGAANEFRHMMMGYVDAVGIPSQGLMRQMIRAIAGLHDATPGLVECMARENQRFHRARMRHKAEGREFVSDPTSRALRSIAWGGINVHKDNKVFMGVGMRVLLAAPVAPGLYHPAVFTLTDGEWECHLKEHVDGAVEGKGAQGADGSVATRQPEGPGAASDLRAVPGAARP